MVSPTGTGAVRTKPLAALPRPPSRGWRRWTTKAIWLSRTILWRCQLQRFVCSEKWTIHTYNVSLGPWDVPCPWQSHHDSRRFGSSDEEYHRWKSNETSWYAFRSFLFLILVQTVGMHHQWWWPSIVLFPLFFLASLHFNPLYSLSSYQIS